MNGIAGTVCSPVSGCSVLEIFRMSYTTPSTQQHVVNVADKHYTTQYYHCYSCFPVYNHTLHWSGWSNGYIFQIMTLSTWESHKHTPTSRETITSPSVRHSTTAHHSTSRAERRHSTWYSPWGNETENKVKPAAVRSGENGYTLWQSSRGQSRRETGNQLRRARRTAKFNLSDKTLNAVSQKNERRPADRNEWKSRAVNRSLE